MDASKLKQTQEVTEVRVNRLFIYFFNNTGTMNENMGHYEGELERLDGPGGFLHHVWDKQGEHWWWDGLKNIFPTYGSLFHLPSHVFVRVPVPLEGRKAEKRWSHTC